MKIVVRSLSNPSKYQIEEVIGHIPDNFVREAPEEVGLDDSDFLLVTENGDGTFDVSVDQQAKAQAEQAANQQRQFDAAVARKLARIEFGKRVMAIMALRNDEKDLSSTDYLTMLSDPQLQAIKGLLDTGALQSARDVIALFAVGEESYFDQADKDAILSILDNYIEAELQG